VDSQEVLLVGNFIAIVQDIHMCYIRQQLENGTVFPTGKGGCCNCQSSEYFERQKQTLRPKGEHRTNCKLSWEQSYVLLDVPCCKVVTKCNGLFVCVRVGCLADWARTCTFANAPAHTHTHTHTYTQHCQTKIYSKHRCHGDAVGSLALFPSRA